ncbi:STAS domain-containing protein [Streptomyces sp. NRRL S-1022]|uniref:STAS domain-containing protein n=1 Tax=Streptomyces sp. NRRL S-1022 TaxID=1463880 RepID=UPI0004C00859|nr:STAS domain-containing protein [Streptomyces sp. NRRL S-1022]
MPVAPRLDVHPLPGRSGFRAAGEVSLPTRGIWERALERAVREGEDVYHLELSALTFVDVAGVGALADAARSLGGGRRLVLDRPPDAVPRILELLWPGLPGIEVSAC